MPATVAPATPRHTPRTHSTPANPINSPATWRAVIRSVGTSSGTNSRVIRGVVVLSNPASTESTCCSP